MSQKAAITVLLPREEVQRQWQSSDYRAEFKDAPGNRGTEIHVEVDGKSKDRAKAMDELRRFKQLAETGEITRSDGVPDGEKAERKLKQRPAQPVGAS